MTNATIAFTRLVATRNEGGVANAVQAAQALVGQHFPGRTFDAAPVVNRFFTALDGGNRAGAEEVINEALATLNQPEPTPVVAADAAVAEDTTNHEARIVALEQIARRNGFGHDLAVPNGVGSHEARLTALEQIARRANLR